MDQDEISPEVQRRKGSISAGSSNSIRQSVTAEQLRKIRVTKRRQKRSARKHKSGTKPRPGTVEPAQDEQGPEREASEEIILSQPSRLASSSQRLQQSPENDAPIEQPSGLGQCLVEASNTIDTPLAESASGNNQVTSTLHDKTIAETIVSPVVNNRLANPTSVESLRANISTTITRDVEPSSESIQVALEDDDRDDTSPEGPSFGFMKDNFGGSAMLVDSEEGNVIGSSLPEGVHRDSAPGW